MSEPFLEPERGVYAELMRKLVSLGFERAFIFEGRCDETLAEHIRDMGHWCYHTEVVAHKGQDGMIRLFRLDDSGLPVLSPMTTVYTGAAIAHRRKPGPDYAALSRELAAACKCRIRCAASWTGVRCKYQRIVLCLPDGTRCQSRWWSETHAILGIITAKQRRPSSSPTPHSEDSKQGNDGDS